MAVAIEVPAWPTVNWSYGLSAGLGKPLMPSAWRSRSNPRLAAGEDLVGVALVADVPQQLVALEVEDVVQGDRQLDDAEVAGQVPARLADRTSR